MFSNFLQPVAIIDSGIGGLKLLKELSKIYPAENYLYYADYSYMPYGNKSKESIKKRLTYIINLLIEKYKIKMVVLACNTATLSSINYLRKRFKIQIYGVSPKIYGQNCLILSTKLTAKLLDENLNSTFIKENDKRKISGYRIVGISSLASYIENNFYDKNKIIRKLKSIGKKYHFDEHKKIILACTHYEYIAEYFKEAFPNKRFISPISKTINEIKAHQVLKTKSEKTIGNIFMISSNNYKSTIDKLYFAYKKLQHKI